MKQLLRDLGVSAGTLASFIGLVLAVRSPGQGWTAWQFILLAIAITFSAALIVIDFFNYRDRPEKFFRGEEKIRKYMHKWIASSGRVAIFSRDLSWVYGNVQTLLEQKALKGELTVVLPGNIPKSEELKARGAEIICYPGIDYVIKSRFTVVNIGRSDTRVAIGRTNGDVHRVEEFSASSDKPAFYLAQDMLEIISRFSVKISDDLS